MLKIKDLFKFCLILFLAMSPLYAGDNSRLGGENGEQWHIGQNVHIWWDLEKITSDFVNIYLWDGNETKLITIAENTPNASASFDWQIPESINPGNFYKIKIISAEDKLNFIMSENFFPIYNILAVEEQNNVNMEYAISIYPNPASDYIYINSPLIEGAGGAWQYHIYDILGNCVQNGIIESNKINISKLSSGFYTVRFFNGGKQLVEKMIRE
jgi:hypothetical protein